MFLFCLSNIDYLHAYFSTSNSLTIHHQQLPVESSLGRSLREAGTAIADSISEYKRDEQRREMYEKEAALKIHLQQQEHNERLREQKANLEYLREYNAYKESLQSCQYYLKELAAENLILQDERNTYKAAYFEYLQKYNTLLNYILIGLLLIWLWCLFMLVKSLKNKKN